MPPPISRSLLRPFLAAMAAALLYASCAPLSPIRDVIDPPTPQERYAESLRGAGLDDTVLGRAWLVAAERALLDPSEVDAPYRGVGYLPAERPSARGYLLTLRRGQALRVVIDWEAEESGAAFVDLFRVGPAEGEGPAFRHLASADTAGRSLDYEVPRDGRYVLRLQTELLRGARYHLTIQTATSLAFPVAGHDGGAIRSAFGDPRDGGRRAHHGVDIFAPRGTPVLAATEGRVARVGSNRLGGNIVWLRDEERGLRLYYAHLDRQLVRGGERVRPGDTLGLVGNSGNARTTPPHLHFGVYARGEGPLDPFPFIYAPAVSAPELELDAAALGTWLRTGRRANLRSTPGLERPPVRTLEAHTPVRALAGTGRWFRVALPDGSTGFLHAPLVEPLENPISSRVVTESRPLLDRPSIGGLEIDSVPRGARVAVLGAFGDYLMVSHEVLGSAWLASAP